MNFGLQILRVGKNMSFELNAVLKSQNSFLGHRFEAPHKSKLKPNLFAITQTFLLQVLLLVCLYLGLMATAFGASSEKRPIVTYDSVSRVFLLDGRDIAGDGRQTFRWVLTSRPGAAPGTLIQATIFVPGATLSLARNPSDENGIALPDAFSAFSTLQERSFGGRVSVTGVITTSLPLKRRSKTGSLNAFGALTKSSTVFEVETYGAPGVED